MRSSLILSLALGLLAGCSSHHSPRSAPPFTFNTNDTPRSARPQAQARDRRSPAPPARKESDRSLIDLSRQWGRIASVNNQLHFVVLDFSVARMPAVNQVLTIYRAGQKIGEVKVSGPAFDNNIAADLLSGSPQIGDEVRPR